MQNYKLEKGVKTVGLIGRRRRSALDCSVIGEEEEKEEEIVTQFRVTVVSPNFNLSYSLRSEGVLKDSKSTYSETPCIITCFHTHKNPHLCRYK
jgi:hypothetical protein